jgi:shikimate dehydrogenase
VAAIGLYDTHGDSARALAARLKLHYPARELAGGSHDPAGSDVVVNATPLGMNEGDPLPMDVARIAPGTFVGEVVMKQEYTPLLQAARAKGCPVAIGTDMLFEMIPAYLEFFGYRTTTPENLRALSTIKY